MSYDKTCCGTTCDAKANAEYVAKLENFVAGVATHIDFSTRIGGKDCLTHLSYLIKALASSNPELIKHAQQNHSTTE